jgi:hypothetical protein
MPARVPRAGRWAPISGSGNLDTAYRQLWREPDKAYAYHCWCRPPFWDRDSKDDKGACDGGKTCLCGKPAQDQPNHKWVSTFACRSKFLAQVAMARLRDPENFDMHTFSDHEGQGMVELVENLLLDFVETDGNWREQWVVCEAMALFLRTDLADALLG